VGLGAVPGSSFMLPKSEPDAIGTCSASSASSWASVVTPSAITREPACSAHATTVAATEWTVKL